MYKRLFLASLLLWLAAAGAAGVLFVRGTTAPGSDGRTAIRLSLSERDFVLGEMRTMLGAVQGVAEGIAAKISPPFPVPPAAAASPSNAACR